MAIVAQPQGRYASLDSNMGLLQEMVRKDPESYKEEFEERFFRFEQRMNLFVSVSITFIYFLKIFFRTSTHIFIEMILMF